MAHKKSGEYEKLNIAMLGHKRVPSREGGIEIVVEELSKRMVTAGHKVTCYNRRGHHVGGKEFDVAVSGSYEGVTLKSVFTVDKKGIAAMSSSLSAAVRAAFGKYDVVHFHAEGPCVMLWLPKLFGKRCVATIHGLDWDREKWKTGLGSKYIKLGEKVAVKYADEIIVLSSNVKQYFMDSYSRKTHFIPNGVTRPEIYKAELIIEKYGLQKDSYFLFVGRIVPEKGLRYLIQAFKQVKTDKKLVIVGGSSDTNGFFEEIKELANEDNRILFTGFVQGKLLEELYSNAYIYTLPSDLEGMPLSLLEAMSYGNCCLVSDIDECAEVVEGRAAVFPRGDVKLLKGLLQELCDQPEQVQNYKQDAADFICQKYNWDNVVRRTLELYIKNSK